MRFALRFTKFLSLLTLLMVGIGITGPRAALGSSNDNLNTILDLESKITLKVRSIVQPVDPDAIVIVKVEVQKINTELAGTQMSAIGIMATADVQSVEETDIQSITVSVISSMNPFPVDVKSLIDSTLRGFSKKAQVRIVPMSAAMSKAILQGRQNKSELLEKSKAGWQKTSELADQLSQLTKQIPDFVEAFKKNFLYLLIQLIVVYTLIQGAIVFIQKRAQGSSVGLLKDALSNLNINSTLKSSDDSESASANAFKAPEAETPKNQSGAGSGFSGSITTKDNPIEQMYIPQIRDLVSDCYWCEKDHYASWVWSQLSPPKRMELLESWPPMIYYVKFFTHLEPQPDTYHFDPIYLKPREYYMHNNEDLLQIVLANPYLWSEISILRQKAFKISLKQRIDFMRSAHQFKPDKPFEWPYTDSPLRVLTTRLEVSELTLQDESMILQDPGLIPNSYRDSIHSLVWLALLPREEQDKILQKLPAQVLAEIWIGPEEMLRTLSDVLPPKKQELLSSYRQKATPQRDHPALRYVSDTALGRYRELNPPEPEIENVVLPMEDFSTPLTSLHSDAAQTTPTGPDEIDVDALVAAFRDGTLEEQPPALAPVSGEFQGDHKGRESDVGTGNVDTGDEQKEDETDGEKKDDDKKQSA